MQPLQIFIGSTICIGQESWCLPYAGFLSVGFLKNLLCQNENKTMNNAKNGRKQHIHQLKG
jgi:hypothetical protein